jgi:hypothetical protein
MPDDAARLDFVRSLGIPADKSETRYIILMNCHGGDMDMAIAGAMLDSLRAVRIDVTLAHGWGGNADKGRGHV